MQTTTLFSDSLEEIPSDSTAKPVNAPETTESPADTVPENDADFASNTFSFQGIPWDVIAAICELPARQIPILLKTAILLRHSKGLKRPAIQIAAQIDVTETTLVAATAALPQLFEFLSKGAVIKLKTEAPDPWDLDPKALKELQKAEEKRRKGAERAANRAEKDGEDTPFNRLRAALEGMGLEREDARKFGGYISRTYGHDNAMSLVTQAQTKKPSEPKAFIIALAKRSLNAAGTISNGGRPLTVRATARPDPRGITQFIGWEAKETNGQRMKLYRRPDGRLIREAPLPDETIPSFTEAPGYTVID